LPRTDSSAPRRTTAHTATRSPNHDLDASPLSGTPIVDYDRSGPAAFVVGAAAQVIGAVKLIAGGPPGRYSASNAGHHYFSQRRLGRKTSRLPVFRRLRLLGVLLHPRLPVWAPSSGGLRGANCCSEGSREVERLMRERMARRHPWPQGASHGGRPSCDTGAGSGQPAGMPGRPVCCTWPTSVPTPRSDAAGSTPWPTWIRSPQPGSIGTTPGGSCIASVAYPGRSRSRLLRCNRRRHPGGITHKLRVLPNPGWLS
jgi:hypothetical protein